MTKKCYKNPGFTTKGERDSNYTQMLCDTARHARTTNLDENELDLPHQDSSSIRVFIFRWRSGFEALGEKNDKKF